MPKKPAKTSKNAGGARSRPSTSRDASTDKRMSAVIDAIIEKILKSLETNYDTGEQEKP